MANAIIWSFLASAVWRRRIDKQIISINFLLNRFLFLDEVRLLEFCVAWRLSFILAIGVGDLWLRVFSLVHVGLDWLPVGLDCNIACSCVFLGELGVKFFGDVVVAFGLDGALLKDWLFHIMANAIIWSFLVSAVWRRRIDKQIISILFLLGRFLFLDEVGLLEFFVA